MDPDFKLEFDDLFDSAQDRIKLVRREPQIPYPLHTHAFAELVIITRGQGYHFFDDHSSYPIITGDVFTLQGERAHGYRDLNGLCLINLLYDPRLLQGVMEDLYALPGYHALFLLEPALRKQHNFSSRLHLKPVVLSQVLSLVEKIEQEQKEKREGYRFMMTALFRELVGYLCRAYSHLNGRDIQEILAIGRALAHMEENEYRALRLSELEEVSGMNRSTLNRHFNRALGQSPVEYHLRQRLKRAGEMLRTTNLPVTEIAFRCGFEDSNYFSRQFKKMMGTNPLSHRKGH